jgi:hypothetical protein
MIDLLPAGVAVKFARVCSEAVIGGIVTDTFDTAMLLLYTAVVLDDITLEFDTVMVVGDDAVAVMLRLSDETKVIDTAVGVAVAFTFPNDVVPILVLKNLVAILSVPVWFR